MVIAVHATAARALQHLPGGERPVHSSSPQEEVELVDDVVSGLIARYDRELFRQEQLKRLDEERAARENAVLRARSQALVGSLYKSPRGGPSWREIERLRSSSRGRCRKCGLTGRIGRDGTCHKCAPPS
jgi:hypothetical protein